MLVYSEFQLWDEAGVLMLNGHNYTSGFYFCICAVGSVIAFFCTSQMKGIKRMIKIDLYVGLGHEVANRHTKVHIRIREYSQFWAI